MEGKESNIFNLGNGVGFTVKEVIDVARKVTGDEIRAEVSPKRAGDPAKLIASRTASDVTRRCLQLFGGYGYTRDYPIERMMRDAKITEIYEGTSEVQMMVISGALLK